jgi:hypothetical protein
MPRRNSPSRGRRRQPPPVAEPIAPSAEGWARSLVARGLASASILDKPPLSDSPERRTR